MNMKIVRERLFELLQIIVVIMLGGLVWASCS